MKLNKHRTAVTLAATLGLVVSSNAARAATDAESGPALVNHAVELMHAEEVPLVRLMSLVVNGVEQAKIGLEQRTTPEQANAAMTDIRATANKTIEEISPVVREAGVKLAPGVVGPILREKFTDDELRQLLALLESPVRKKFEALLPQIQQAIGQAVTDQTRPQVDPKLQQMSKAISARIGVALVPK